MLVVYYQAGKISMKLLMKIILNWPKDLHYKVFSGIVSRVAFRY